jgi:hypothetical protein
MEPSTDLAMGYWGRTMGLISTLSGMEPSTDLAIGYRGPTVELVSGSLPPRHGDTKPLTQESMVPVIKQIGEPIIGSWVETRVNRGGVKEQTQIGLTPRFQPGSNPRGW